MSNIQQFIARIRDQYLEALTKEIEVYNRTFHQAQVEGLVGNLDQPLPPAFKVQRVDMLSHSANHTDFTECRPQSIPYFRPTKVSLNRQLKIMLEPFTWNEVDIECSSFDPHAPILQQWAYRWIERCERPAGDNRRLSGCAHRISFPHTHSETCRFSVDFGSAEVKCFVELMQVLCRLGVTRARVYSACLYQ